MLMRFYIWQRWHSSPWPAVLSSVFRPLIIDVRKRVRFERRWMSQRNLLLSLILMRHFYKPSKLKASSERWTSSVSVYSRLWLSWHIGGTAERCQLSQICPGELVGLQNVLPCPFLHLYHLCTLSPLLSSFCLDSLSVMICESENRETVDLHTFRPLIDATSDI